MAYPYPGCTVPVLAVLWLTLLTACTTLPENPAGLEAGNPPGQVLCKDYRPLSVRLSRLIAHLRADGTSRV
jgi:hypothetical protein